MYARVVSGILLALGTADLGVLNLVLAPRLQSTSAAVEAGAEWVAERPPAWEAHGEECARVQVTRADTSSDVWAGSTTVTAGTRTATAPVHATTDVTFAFDSTRLEHLETIHHLRRLARELAESPGRSLVLRGHSDPLGVPSHNVELSERRAQAVRDYLVLRGAPADRITVEAIGSNEPADPLQTPSAWAKDRRVEVLWR
jgi:peptidoglycan-associated lipoprotein